MPVQPKNSILSDQPQLKDKTSAVKIPVSSTYPLLCREKQTSENKQQDSLIPLVHPKKSDARKSSGLVLPKNHMEAAKSLEANTAEFSYLGYFLPDSLKIERELKYQKGLPFIFAVHISEDGEVVFFSSADLIEDEEKENIAGSSMILCMHRHLTDPFEVMDLKQWRANPESCLQFLLADFEIEGNEDKEDLIIMSSSKLLLSSMFLLGIKVVKSEDAASDIIRDDPYKNEIGAVSYALLSAIKANSLPLVDHLLNAGAIFNFVDYDGREALIEASEQGKEAVLRRLIKGRTSRAELDAIKDASELNSQYNHQQAASILDDFLEIHNK